jgi:hypothetical protein
MSPANISIYSISGTGITLCIEKALADSGVTREEINYVNAHATSTQSGDLKEYEAIVRCFGQNPEVYILPDARMFEKFRKSNQTNYIYYFCAAKGELNKINDRASYRSSWWNRSCCFYTGKEVIFLDYTMDYYHYGVLNDFFTLIISFRVLIQYGDL